ncbi:MAG: tRNA (adenosine(37)-N6)-dimethylallyltransferase MiaA [Planctomycetes bacterium]|nr:tRNA (adenosine(37)-N6)-dimethylallyltransferase MiaA [Planctomycetota bacterium]
MPDPAPASDPPLWVVTGPTAAGKTALAVALAERLGLEIVSMDSMAVYRRMDIGTAKPSAAERVRVRHHLIDVVEPHETFDTARWCAAAAAALDDIRQRGRSPLFVGGTPLYLMAFFKGLMAGPAADPEVRAALAAREAAAPGSLYAELQQRDPAAAARIDRRDQRRLVRALEVLQLTGRTISEQQQHFARAGWQRPCRIVAVRRERDDLHERVRRRVEAMLASGLLAETEAIERSGGFSPTSGAAIGYAECRLFLRGRFKDLAELRNRIRRNTHQLIRRQTTWFRRLPEIVWLPADASVDALATSLQGAASADDGR